VKFGGGGNHGVSFEFLADRPDVNHAACDAYVAGGEIFDETSHGSPDGYMEGRWFDKNACYRLIIQQRFVMVDSCSSGALGGIANQQLFTRGGGMVYAVGGTITNYDGDFTLRYFPTARDLLSKGESWGRTLLKKYGFGARNRTIHYGDLSIAALGKKITPAFPANEIPKITTFTASATSIKPGESVNFTVNFTDPDATTSDSPAVNYEHQVEWFPAGYDSGRATPTQTLTLNGATSTTYSYTYPTPGIYVARVEVMDEWMARGWKEVTITVNNPPVANLDSATVVAGQSATIAVLANDTDADGQALTLVKVATQPLHGTTKIVGSNIIYTCKDAIWTGTETFTYQIQDTLKVTATGTISVTVVSGVRDRLIEMKTVPGTIWFASEPADAITDAPTSSTQAVHLRHDQNATLKLKPGTSN
jgi:hypothetical protein